MNFQYIFWYLFIVGVSSGSVIKYIRPGSYLLTPNDYFIPSPNKPDFNRITYLTFELWGAGAGGINPCSKDCPDNYLVGGGSGAYTKLSIKTINSSYIINVGKGGKAGMCSSHLDANGSTIYNYTNRIRGEKSSISVQGDKYILVDADAGEFGWGGLEFFPNMDGISTTMGTDAYYFMEAFYGKKISHGGNAPNGGEGGSAFYYNNSNNSFLIYGFDGFFPGGGGAGFCLDVMGQGDSSNNFTVKCGDGASGAIFVYFSVNNETVIEQQQTQSSSSSSNYRLVLFLLFVGFLFVICCTCYFNCRDYDKNINNRANTYELVDINTSLH